MDPVEEMIAILRRAFPDGVDRDDYFALLASLYDDMSDENLAKVISQFTGKNRLDVWNDMPSALSIRGADRVRVEQIASRLRSAGWEPEELGD